MRNFLANTFVSISLSILLSFSVIGEAAAGDFDGWCFPANACTGEQMLISEDTFNTCEEFCEMKNPTKVNNMTGILYNVLCTSDTSAPHTQRMFFLRYTKDNAASGALAISNDGSIELAKCQ